MIPLFPSGRRLLFCLAALFSCVGSLFARINGAPQTPMPGSIGQVDAATAPATRPRLMRDTLQPSELDSEMEFSIALKMRSFGDLQQRLERRERISSREMDQKFHPASADYQSVVAWLTSQGFTITRDDPSRLSVFAKGTVSQVAKAFQVKFGRVQFRGRERTSAITAPTLPSSLAERLVGVNGLQPHLEANKLSRQLSAVNPNAATGNSLPYQPSQIARAYNAASLPQTGAGQTIGIVIDTFPLTSDLTSFWSTCGVNQSLNNVQFVQVVSGTLPAPSGEESLDVEWSSSMAPAAKVRVYAAMDLSFVHLDQAYAQIYSELSSQPGMHQISLSYGLGEAYNTTSQMQTDEQYFANLASAGVTIFVSSGDGGSNPQSSGAAGATTPTVESPSNSPSVTAVGGTSINLNTSGAISSETVWSGSGGGVSTFFARPTWQTGAGLPSGSKRAVPDVSAPADPNTGCLVILNGGSYQYGGTSWSAPTWAGICALINDARASHNETSLGLFGPKIYPLSGTASFQDIVSGSNGAYTAAAGYDECTGIGTPNVSNLLQTLINIPSISSQPTSQVVDPGQVAVFTVVAAAAQPLSYQWQRIPVGSSTWSNLGNTAPYSGTSTPTLNVSNTTDAMRGDQFQCIVSNSFGSLTTSPPATLIVGTSAPLVITTLAGSAGVVNSNNGTGSAARFNYPGGLATDPSGNIFVADTNNHTIRKVTPAGIVTTFAGTAGISGSTNATGASASFYYPSNVAVSSAGNVYVADASNNTIRKITPAAVVSTLAGRAGRSGTTNSTGTNARFNQPLGVAVDGSENVYVADAGNNLIRKITPGGVVSTLAGSAGTAGSVDGAGTAAQFNSPVDVAVDPNGNVFVADMSNNTIRKITPAGVVTTVAGLAGSSGSQDGLGKNARFNAPVGVRSDNSGNIYIADSNNNTIRFLSADGYVTSLAGLAGTSGSADGIASAARFNGLSDAAPDGLGNLYIADTNNQTIRLGTSAAAPTISNQANNPPVFVGQSDSFTITASGNPPPTFKWQRLPAGNSNWINLSDDGTYAGTATATLTVNSATSVMNGDQFRCVATNAIGSATSSAFVLQVQINYTSWKTLHFGSNAGNSSISGPSADPDGDGISNALEYAQGTDPLDSSSRTLPAVNLVLDPADGLPHLTLTALLDASVGDISVNAEVSADLLTWNSGSSYTEVVGDSTTNGVRTLVVRDVIAETAAAPKRFIRLKVNGL